MAFNLSRMTIYAMVSAIEEDLRDNIKTYLGSSPQSDPSIDQTLVTRAKQRLEKEKSFSEDDTSLSSIVDYFDLGDTYQTINSHAHKFPKIYSDHIKSKTKKLENTVPIRNRVMHIRPLNFSDLPSISDFCLELSQENPRNWPKVTRTLIELESNPSYVLSLRIPSHEIDDRIFHNLPMPDFDETGLIGRDETVSNLKKLCLGAFPVISIVGEGGIGKSALALKVAYEILDDPKSLFEAVIWVTSKTTQITANEIREIRGAITSSMGMLTEISDQLTGKKTEDPLSEIIEYLSTFKIALFIDNLETIIDDTIRQLVESLPNGSKIIITSRIGLGAYEYPIKLNGIEEKYASELLRTLGKVRNITTIAKQDENILRRFARRMHLNPGYMKWFVSAIQTGREPETILQNSALFLEFCMSNVYEFLNHDAREITAIMLCESGWKDIPELHFLSGMEAIRIQKSIQELLTTNMLSESSKSFGGSVKTTYQLSELARSYLNKYHKPTKSLQERIKTNRNRLNALVEKNNHSSKNNRYSPSNIKVRSNNDQIIFKRLRDALKFIRDENYELAYETLIESQKLSPDYFEVPRVLAYFNQKKGNISEARANYELAIELGPNTSQLHFWFGKFILNYEQSIDDAVDQFEYANRLDPESNEVYINLARGYMLQHKYADSQKILVSIKPKAESFAENLRGMFYDTCIQVHYRKADDLNLSGDYSECISELMKMRCEFDSLPSDMKNSYLRQKLSKANFITQKLSVRCHGLELCEVQKISDWIAMETNDPRL